MRHLNLVTPRRFGAVAAVAAVLALTFAASAHAWQEGELQNMATGRCLGGSLDLNIDVCDVSTNMLWFQSNYSNGKTRFQNAASQWCLDDSRNGLMIFKCHGDGEGSNRNFQSWSPSGMVAGVPNIQRWQNLATGLCLFDSIATGPITQKCVQHTASNWRNQAWRWSYHAGGWTSPFGARGGAGAE